MRRESKRVSLTPIHQPQPYTPSVKLILTYLRYNIAEFMLCAIVLFSRDMTVEQPRQLVLYKYTASQKTRHRTRVDNFTKH